MADAFAASGDWCAIISSDSFFELAPHRYEFCIKRIGLAHRVCFERFALALERKIAYVIVDNTNVTRREMRPYAKLAVEHGYDVVILEPETPWAFDIEQLLVKNVHNVPRETVERMARRWASDVTLESLLHTAETPDELAAGALECGSKPSGYLSSPPLA